MTNLVYCKRWNQVLKEPNDPIGEDEACRLHVKRTPYSVVLYKEEQPVNVVEMCFFQIYCHVLFLDERARLVGRYSFSETDDGRLFLEQAALHSYRGSDEFVSSGEIFNFQQDGSYSHTEGKAGAGRRTRTEGRTDVSKNYEDVPEFGDYESLTVWERNAQVRVPS